MRSFTTAGQPGRCPRCWVLEAFCVCPLIPTVHTRTEIVIVRHERESWKSTGTARVAALAMPGMRILDYREDAQPALTQLEAEVGAGAHLLFPSQVEAEFAPVTRLIVLDGTWRQTRRMYTKLPPLHALPRVALPPKTTKVLRLREPTFEAARSTLEAIADAVSLLEGEATAAPLHRLHADYVERVFRARGVWAHKLASH
jgi:DTW domain-containing protein YfiP